MQCDHPRGAAAVVHCSYPDKNAQSGPRRCLVFLMPPKEEARQRLANINEKILCSICQNTPLTMDKHKGILPHSYLSRNILTEAFQ